MTKFKKCDDCGTILNGKTAIKIKTGPEFGIGKSKIRTISGGYIERERPAIVYLCKDCDNYHMNIDSGGKFEGYQKGSTLDKILAKKNPTFGNWKKQKEVDEKWKSLEQQNQKNG